MSKVFYVMFGCFKNKIVVLMVMNFGLMLSFVSDALAQRQGLSLIRDTEIEETLLEWGDPIFQAAKLNPDSINIILVQSDVMNAFVAGGSNIFFYTGLITRTENPGELIGVMAHETGHISGGHLIRSREAMERASYESMIATILGVGAAIVSGDGGAMPALALGGSALAQRSYLAHSRVHESSADQAALSFLAKAHINPSGMVSFMEKLQAENYMPREQQSEYIQTHPLVGNRIDVLRRGVANSPYLNTPYPAKWMEQHARMKAKLIGFINPGQIPWVYDDRDVSVAAQYARAIAAYRNNQVDDAIARIDALLMGEPQNPYFLELKGQMLVDFGRVSEAVPYYRQSIAIMPNAGLLRIALGHALIESADNDRSILNDAIKQLERALIDEPRSSRVYRLLATAYGRIGKPNEARLYLAEEAVLERRFDTARQNAQSILSEEKEGSVLWVKAKDILSFIENVKKE